MFNKLFSLSIAAGILIPNVALSEQVIIQQGSANATDNATAIGNDDKIINNTRQYNRQNQWRY